MFRTFNRLLLLMLLTPTIAYMGGMRVATVLKQNDKVIIEKQKKSSANLLDMEKVEETETSEDENCPTLPTFKFDTLSLIFAKFIAQQIAILPAYTNLIFQNKVLFLLNRSLLL